MLWSNMAMPEPGHTILITSTATAASADPEDGSIVLTPSDASLAIHLAALLGQRTQTAKTLCTPQFTDGALVGLQLGVYTGSAELEGWLSAGSTLGLDRWAAEQTTLHGLFNGTVGLGQGTYDEAWDGSTTIKQL